MALPRTLAALVLSAAVLLGLRLRRRPRARSSPPPVSTWARSPTSRVGSRRSRRPSAAISPSTAHTCRGRSPAGRAESLLTRPQAGSPSSPGRPPPPPPRPPSQPARRTASSWPQPGRCETPAPRSCSCPGMSSTSRVGTSAYICGPGRSVKHVVRRIGGPRSPPRGGTWCCCSGPLALDQRSLRVDADGAYDFGRARAGRRRRLLPRQRVRALDRRRRLQLPRRPVSHPGGAARSRAGHSPTPTASRSSSARRPASAATPRRRPGSRRTATWAALHPACEGDHLLRLDLRRRATTSDCWHTPPSWPPSPRSARTRTCRRCPSPSVPAARGRLAGRWPTG